MLCIDIIININLLHMSRIYIVTLFLKTILQIDLILIINYILLLINGVKCILILNRIFLNYEFK